MTDDRSFEGEGGRIANYFIIFYSLLVILRLIFNKTKNRKKNFPAVYILCVGGYYFLASINRFKILTPASETTLPGPNMAVTPLS